jgi:probable rRNA maturation factor
LAKIGNSNVTIAIEIAPDELNPKERAFVAEQEQRARRALAAWLARLAPEYRGELSVLFCSDSSSHRLNRDYRGKDKATDVLSFVLLDELYRGEGWQGEDFTEPLGDILVNITQLYRQHADWGNSPQEELGRLLAHGLLHLLGFDHELGEQEQQAMRQQEDELFLIWEKI